MRLKRFSIRTPIWPVAGFLYTLVPSSRLHNTNPRSSVDTRTDRIIVALPHETEEIFHEDADMAGGGVPVHVCAVITFTQHESAVFYGQTD